VLTQGTTSERERAVESEREREREREREDIVLHTGLSARVCKPEVSRPRFKAAAGVMKKKKKKLTLMRIPLRKKEK